MNSYYEIVPCVIIAGGKGKRMGGKEKALINFLDRPLISYIIEKVSGNCFVTNDYEKEILECGTKCEEVIGETLNGEEYLQNFIKEGPKPNITPDKIKKEYLIKEIMNETVFTNNTDFPKGTFLEKNQQSFNTLIELQKGIK